jgi:DNA-directed RNA polymerase subunit L
MNIDNISHVNEKIEFDINGVHRYIPNSLRRTILSKIESIVFKGFPHVENNINITTNTTRFHNEYLKQRIECIPVQIPNYAKFDTYIKQYDYVLDVENVTSEKMVVTTEHLKLRFIKTGAIKKLNFLPSDGEDHIPICYLYPRISQNDPPEKLSLSINLTKGSASDNASWNVVSKCVFFNNEDTDEVQKQAALITDKSKQRDFMLLDAQRIFIKDSFHMHIESVGIYPCPDIMTLACDVLIKTLTAIEEEVDGTKYTHKNDLVIPNTHLIYLHNNNNTFMVRLEKEDYTIGTLVEYGLFKQAGVKTVTFLKEHSHDTHCFISATLNDDVMDEEEEFKKLLKTGLRDIVNIYTTIKNRFEN